MKKRLSVILILALVFTTVFAVSPAFAYEDEEYSPELKFKFNFSTDDIHYHYASVYTEEELFTALSEDGLYVEVPYGFLSDYGGEEQYHEVDVSALVSKSSNVTNVDLENGPYSDEYEDYILYYQDFESSELVKADGYQVLIDVTREDYYGDEYTETYRFNFVEDDGSSLDVYGLGYEYCDDYERYHSDYVDFEENLDSIEDGLNINLPYYYDNNVGIQFYCDNYGIVQSNIKDVYFLSNDKLSFTLTLKSANGEKTLSIPVSITRDSDGTSTDLEEICVNCYDYYDDDTYFDNYYYADLNKINDFNEVYVEIPTWYQTYDEYDEPVGYEHVADIGNIDLWVTAAGSARIDCSYTEDGYYFEDYSRSAYWYLEDDFDDEDDVNVYAKFDVYSGNMNVKETYTVYTIVSDCQGNHNFSSWKTTENGTNGISYRSRKCSDCPYVEKEKLLNIDNLSITTNEASGKPKLTWDKAVGASKYYVYRATSKNGSYTYLGSTTNTYYTNTSAVAGKTYYYKVKAVDANGDTGEYSAVKSITCDLAQPTNVRVSTVASSGSPKVSWDKVDGADKYYVYRSTSKNGSYTYLGYTTGTSYTNASAVAGNTYYYRVKAIDADNEYANSAPATSSAITCDLAQPTNVKVNNVASSGKPKITWNKVEDADRYYVYRSTSKNGTYSYLGSTTNTHYTNTGAKAGTTYYYKVKAVSDKTEYANSAQSSYCYITCDLAQPTNVKVNNVASSGKPKVTWDAVSGADKYYVYRSTSKNGSYTYMYSTTNTSYTNTNAVAGTCYYYKVKAVDADKDAANSALSNSCYITCDLAKPSIKVTLSNNKPKISWDAVSGAEKYEVYRKVGTNGTYSKYFTTSYTSFTNSGATKGTKYYYKVVAVCAKSTYGNSAYSNEVAITSK